jgi:hypothetical protein
MRIQWHRYVLLGSIGALESAPVHSEMNPLRVKLVANPSKSDATLIVTSDDRVAARIQIADLLGKTVLNELRVLEPGSQTISLHTSSLSPGHYVCRIESGGFVQSVKIVKE